MNEINKKRTIVSQNESNAILVVGKCTHVLIHFHELYTLKDVYQTSRQTVTYVPRADLGVGPGSHGPLFCQGSFFLLYTCVGWYFELCYLNIFSLINRALLIRKEAVFEAIFGRK